MFCVLWSIHYSVSRLFKFRSVFLRFYSMDTAMASGSWRGVPLSEIIGSQSPWGAPEFPLVNPSHNHAVLYHVSSDSVVGERPPRPHVGQDKWDNEYVRLPCSSKSLYPVEDEQGETQLKKRWGMIENALRRPIRNSRELADAILSYNIKFKDRWKFTALHTLFEEHLDEDEANYFFNVTLPEIAKLALDLPKLVQAPIPLLKQHKNQSVSLSQQQVASLLANAFFCTFPRRNTTKRLSEYGSYPHINFTTLLVNAFFCTFPRRTTTKRLSEYASYPHINFTTLYESNGHDDILEKLKCICHYFRRVCTKVPTGAMTFSRRSVSPRACPQWTSSDALLAAVPLHVDASGTIEDAHGLIQIDFANNDALLAAVPLHVDASGTIEDAHGLIQMDFANKYLGGGVLGHGSVQEEIRFVICPELMASMLFTEELRPNEALMMIGCERYSNYLGYGYKFKWAGDYHDETPLDACGRRRCAVLAVDALPCHGRTTEFRREHITRDLNKAWVGFSFYTAESDTLNYPGIATGNWGCGAFGGSPQLKSLIQLMAAAEAQRPVAYYTFGDVEIRDELVSVYNLLARHYVTVGELYWYLVRFSAADVAAPRSSHLHSFLQQALLDKRKATQTVTVNATQPFQPISRIEPETTKQPENSPDLFSQEYDAQEQASTYQREPLLSDSIISEDGDITADENKMEADVKMPYKMDYKMTSGHKMAVEHKMADNMEDHKMAPDVKTATEKKNKTVKDKTVLENRMAHTSRLFEEMEKLDEESGNLNLSASHSKFFESDNKINTQSSSFSVVNEKSKNVTKSMDSGDQRNTSEESNTNPVNDSQSFEDNLVKSDVPADLKKKLTKKITDYFSKKS